MEDSDIFVDEMQKYVNLMINPKELEEQGTVYNLGSGSIEI